MNKIKKIIFSILVNASFFNSIVYAATNSINIPSVTIDPKSMGSLKIGMVDNGNGSVKTLTGYFDVSCDIVNISNNYNKPIIRIDRGNRSRYHVVTAIKFDYFLLDNKDIRLPAQTLVSNNGSKLYIHNFIAGNGSSVGQLDFLNLDDDDTIRIENCTLSLSTDLSNKRPNKPSDDVSVLSVFAGRPA